MGDRRVAVLLAMTFWAVFGWGSVGRLLCQANQFIGLGIEVREYGLVGCVVGAIAFFFL